MVFAAVAIGGWTMLLPEPGTHGLDDRRGRDRDLRRGLHRDPPEPLRFDNELRFRGQAHRDLSDVLNDPKVKAGAELRPPNRP